MQGGVQAACSSQVAPGTVQECVSGARHHLAAGRERQLNRRNRRRQRLQQAAQPLRQLLLLLSTPLVAVGLGQLSKNARSSPRQRCHALLKCLDALPRLQGWQMHPSEGVCSPA